jgi:DNA topoisomerase-1
VKLVIVESPAKAKTIEKYLSDIDDSDKFVVRASVGHVRDLPKSNKKAIDIPAGFVPHYEVVANKKQVIQDLRALANKADEIILATDPDREGEAIAWHIQEELGLRKPERIVFHEITKDAIAEALKHPRHIDDNLRLAQEARRVLDRLVGYDLSGLVWKKVRYGLSAGRVQSPALRILMEREREIRAFIPETYWVITANTKTPKKTALALTCAQEPRDKKVVDHIIAAVEKDGLTVAEVSETEAKRSTRAPFTTSTLQQAASSRLGFSPANTMRIAQKLYESGHITYMRTDSTNLAAPARAAILSTIEKKFGKEYLAPHTFKATSKNAQEAHEAIRPTNIANTACTTADKPMANEILFLSGIIKKENISFFEVKGYLEALFKDLGIHKYEFRKTESGGAGADIYVWGKKIGEIEILERTIIDFEINFSELLNYVTLKKTYTQVPKFPQAQEDIRLIIDPSVTYEKVTEVILKTSTLVTNISLLDTYHDKKTFRITYQSKDKSLTSSEIAETRAKILENLKKFCNAYVS